MTSQNFYNADGTTDPTGLNSSTLVAGAAYSYDHDSNLTGLTYKDGADTLVAGYHYDYNTAGLVTDEYSFADSSATTPNTSYVSGSSNWGEVSYNYDPNGQLANSGSGGSTVYAVSYNNNFIERASLRSAARPRRKPTPTIPTATAPVGRGRLACGKRKFRQPRAL